MAKSNMYDWITGTWNPLAGECPHKCVYCSTKSIPWKSVREKYSGELRLDEKAMKKSLGRGNTWFVCAQNDLFAEGVPQDIIRKIRDYCLEFIYNRYVFQTKNPIYIIAQQHLFPVYSIIGCTIETNRDVQFIGNAPNPKDRVAAMMQIVLPKFITIEPILDFDVDILAGWINQIRPQFVNIGADSKKHNLPEPSADKVHALIEKLTGYGIEIREKHNLDRLVK